MLPKHAGQRRAHCAISGVAVENDHGKPRGLVRSHEPSAQLQSVLGFKGCGCDAGQADALRIGRLTEGKVDELSLRQPHEQRDGDERCREARGRSRRPVHSNSLDKVQHM